MNKSKWSGFANLILILFAIMGIFIAVGTLVEWQTFLLWTSSGVTTQATVVYRSTVTNKRIGTSYYVTYRYIVNDHTYQEEEAVIFNTYKSVDSGLPIAIWYVRSDPAVSHIGEGENPIRVILLTILTLVWNGLLIFAWTKWRSARPLTLNPSPT